MSDPIEMTVGELRRPVRVDKWLAAEMADTPGASRSAIQRWIEAGQVWVDGTTVSTKHKLRGGERIEVRPAAPPPSKAIAQDLPLTILHEDDALVVVHKPAGLVVHPAPGHPDGTLVNALLHHVRFDVDGDPMRPGIVHRLDRDTSGVMVVAKTIAAREHLTDLFASHAIERRYDAIVVGRFARATTFETLHGRHPKDRKRFTTKVAEGRRAVTHVRPVEPLAGATRVQCTLETGRTHQIRVHCTEAGHPILADATYGGSRTHARGTATLKAGTDAARLQDAAGAIGRQALHAAVLGFDHPDGGTLRFEAPAPPDFAAALQLLRDPP